MRARWRGEKILLMMMVVVQVQSTYHARGAFFDQSGEGEELSEKGPSYVRRNLVQPLFCRLSIIATLGVGACGREELSICGFGCDTSISYFVFFVA